MILSRRKLIGSLGLVFAAPAIVRASRIMPVKAVTAPSIEDLLVMALRNIPSIGETIVSHLTLDDWLTAQQIAAGFQPDPGSDTCLISRSPSLR